jgi:RHS repeat-associated protein
VRVASKLGGGGIANITTPIVNTDYKRNAWQTPYANLWHSNLNLAPPCSTYFYSLLNAQTVQNSEPERYFYHPDHLGSASWITDSSGQAIQHLQYLPFGETRVDQRETSWSTRYSFSAKEKDEESGYSYFGARYYDSDLSIWLSVDPMASDYPSTSAYAYCGNNPLRLIDPNGEDWYEVVNPTTQEKEVKWTDYKSQQEMDDNKVQGSYLGEAFVHFQGSKDEKVGKDGTLTGEGAKAAQVTIYGINGKDDIKTYRGLTMSSNSEKYSQVASGDYKAYYEDMATSPYGYAGAKKRGIETALTYRVANLDGSKNLPIEGGGNNKVTGKPYLGGIFFHRTDWNGTARKSSQGCPNIDGSQWKDVQKQLGKSSNIRIRITRN